MLLYTGAIEGKKSDRVLLKRYWMYCTHNTSSMKLLDLLQMYRRRTIGDSYSEPETKS